MGFSQGVFDLLQLPDLLPIHTLSIGREKLTSLAFSPAGDWIAVGGSLGGMAGGVGWGGLNGGLNGCSSLPFLSWFCLLGGNGAP